jgi:hypothetical protein
MSGAAVNTGRGGGGQPQGGGAGPGGGEGGPGGIELPGGGERPGPGGIELPGGGERPGPGGIELPNLEASLPFLNENFTGFAPFSGEGLDIFSRFGERGPGNFNLGDMFPGGEGFSPPWQQGGFGAQSEGGFANQVRNIEGTPWRPDGVSTGVPAAPSAIANVDPSAQSAARDAVREASGEERINEATESAQEAYDQVWDDYYEAVDYTAQTYYDTVTASTDYILESYYEAVDYTTESTDYYEEYSDDYEDYCSAYSWDCYSYTYNTTNNTYYYTGDVSDDAVTTTESGDVTTTESVPVGVEPSPSAEAYSAIVIFANDQLGAVVEPLYAGTATGEVQALLGQLPEEIQAYFLNTLSISGDAYWGLLYGGVAGVAVGDCTTSDCAVTRDNLDVHLSNGSAGAYSILADSAMPTTTAEALDLITKVYPRLEGLAFAQITDVEGLAFTATTASMGVDATTGEPISVAKVVYAGTFDLNGQPLVYAVVAVGEGMVAAATGSGS